MAATKIPLFGGAAHGQWVDAAKKPLLGIRAADETYAVHWVVTHGSDDALWFGIAEGYVPKLHCQEVVDAYAERDKTNEPA